MVESVDSDSARELELVSEAGDVASEAGVIVDCRGTGAEVSRSAG